MKNKKYIAVFLSLASTFLFLNGSKESQAQETELTRRNLNQCQESGNQSCCVDFSQAIESASLDWQNNLSTLKDQQKPASDMVDEAYENLRSYNCWLEYICRSVQYSGYGPIESGIGGLTSDQLGQAPGCQEPEDMTLENNFDIFINSLKNDPGLNIDPNVFYKNGRINYFPSCQTDPINNNQNPILDRMNGNFQVCKAMIESKFGCNAQDADFGECVEESTSMIVLETTLKKAHGDQKATALETKLSQIVTRMHSMQEHVTYMANFLSQLDQRLACIAFKCT